jgi:ubiquinone/menaquinone biosynthesis C-methylase UbiE
MSQKRLVQQQFTLNPTSYVTSPVHATTADLDRLLEVITPEPHWRVLDVATGGGHTARLFAPHVAGVVAADLTLPMLHAARQSHREADLTGITYHQLDAESLPYAPASFEAVTCRIAPHHFPHPDEFVRECVRILRPGGLLVVIDQIMPRNRKAARYVNAFERLRDPSHAWAYSLPRWEGFFKAEGLTITYTESFTQRHILTDWAARMNVTPDNLIRLRAMLIQAPEKAAQWMDAAITSGGDATFLIHRGLIIGQKS